MAMTKTEKLEFLIDLIDNVKADLICSVDKLPEEWDGHELRQLVADRFAEVSWSLREDRKRMRDYRNFLRTHSIRS